MNKQEFLAGLEQGLFGLPQEDIQDRLAFYGEMVEDRMEEGLTEPEAVEAIGGVEDVVAQILAETPLAKLVKERVKPSRALRVWEIVLLVLGSPIWLSLLIAVIAVILAVYIVLWSAVITLWTIFASFAASLLGGLVAAVILVLQGYGLVALAMLGAGLCCGGLAISLFFGSRGATKGILLLTKKLALQIKRCFMGKGAPQ